MKTKIILALVLLLILDGAAVYFLSHWLALRMLQQFLYAALVS